MTNPCLSLCLFPMACCKLPGHCMDASGADRDSNCMQEPPASWCWCRWGSLKARSGTSAMDGGMEVRDWCGDLVTIVSKVNNVYPTELKVIAPSAETVAWRDDRGCREPTHQDIVGCLNSVMLAATAKGEKDSKATLMTWHGQLGHPSFKTVVKLAKSHMGRMAVRDLRSASLSPETQAQVRALSRPLPNPSALVSDFNHYPKGTCTGVSIHNPSGYRCIKMMNLQFR